MIWEPNSHAALALGPAINPGRITLLADSDVGRSVDARRLVGRRKPLLGSLGACVGPRFALHLNMISRMAGPHLVFQAKLIEKWECSTTGSCLDTPPLATRCAPGPDTLKWCIWPRYLPAWQPNSHGHPHTTAPMCTASLAGRITKWGQNRTLGKYI